MTKKCDIFAPQENTLTNSLDYMKILLYGGNSTGKTYVSSMMEKPLLLMAESGGNALNIPKFPIENWDKFVNIVQQLANDIDRTKEVYQTIIIDTVDELIALAENKVAKRFGVIDVGMVQDADTNNPNGYSLARQMFRQQVNLLTSLPLTVIFISHETVDEDYIDYAGNTVNKIVPFNSNKEKSSMAFIRNLCDFVFYTKARGVNTETGETILSAAICKETDKVFARSRFPNISARIDPFTAENLANTIKNAVENRAEEVGMPLTDKPNTVEEYTKEDYFDMIKPYMMKLFEIYPDYVTRVVAENLGDGKKLTDATDNQLVELSAIYNDFVSYSIDRGVEI